MTKELQGTSVYEKEFFVQKITLVSRGFDCNVITLDLEKNCAIELLEVRQTLALWMVDELHILHLQTAVGVW